MGAAIASACGCRRGARGRAGRRSALPGPIDRGGGIAVARASSERAASSTRRRVRDDGDCGVELEPPKLTVASTGGAASTTSSRPPSRPKSNRLRRPPGVQRPAGKITHVWSSRRSRECRASRSRRCSRGTGTGSDFVLPIFVVRAVGGEHAGLVGAEAGRAIEDRSAVKKRAVGPQGACRRVVSTPPQDSTAHVPTPPSSIFHRPGIRAVGVRQAGRRRVVVPAAGRSRRARVRGGARRGRRLGPSRGARGSWLLLRRRRRGRCRGAGIAGVAVG